MKKRTILAAASLLAVSMPSFSEGWNNQIGLSYASGVSDVADIYEENLEASMYVDEVDVTLIPIGASYAGHYQFGSGLRTGLGVGPLFMVLGDASHKEAPINANIGWTFSTEEKLSPFFALGMAKHFVSGDYVESDSAGLYVEAGLTYEQFGVKLSVDKSEVEFETTQGLKSINSYDTVLTVFAQF